MEDTDDEVVRLQNELDEWTKQEEQLAKRRHADNLRRQVQEKKKSVASLRGK